MNRTHRIIFNHRTGLAQVVSESARSRSKGMTSTIVRTALCTLPLLGLAGTAVAASSLPSGGVVTSGQASISSSGSTLSVNQSSGSAAINWQSFSIGSGYTVNFNQPSSSSVTLNRVVGNERSVIEGALNANGRVFLVNSNGILFGSGASVNVGGLVASTLNISDADFAAGHYVFAGSSSAGAVLNMGTLTAADGGYVALLGPQVANEGVIVASRGTVALASGQKVSLNFNGDSLLSVSVDEGTLDALVANKGAIYADGGSVVLTARAADDLVASQVNNSGVIQARTVEDLTGSITLNAVGGTTTVTGTLDASAPDGGNGGSIETSGDHVKVADSATITTQAPAGASGTWLIDPDGFTIGASGDMTGTALGAALNQGSVTIASTSGSGSDGDVTVNDAVSWSGNTTLTLKATHDININNAIAASGASAGLSLYYGGDYYIRTPASYAGTTTDSNGNLVAQTDTSGGVYGSVSFTACQDAASCAGTSLTINGQTYILIGSMSQFDALDGYNAATASGTASTVSGYYAIAHDLQASGSTYSAAPISVFSGTLTGLGNTINGLTITASSPNVGLTGQTASKSVTTLRDISLTNVAISYTDINSSMECGALLGLSLSSILNISNAYSTGTINGGSTVGGLVGETAYSGVSTLSHVFSEVNITSSGNAGGLIGSASGSGSNGYETDISYAYAKGSVTGTSTYGGGGSNLGGLVGYMRAGSVSHSYAAGNVTGHSVYSGATLYNSIDIGGLIGNLAGSTASHINTVASSFATGDVYGGYNVGGLIGLSGNAGERNTYYNTIENVYATGDVTATTATYSGETNVGGLIGNATYSNVDNAYATGKVSATMNEGYYTESSGVPSENIGGLVGYSNSTISNSYATGSVTGSSVSINVGGLAGTANIISDSYATGTVYGRITAGGLAGTANTISDSYSTGAVSGQIRVGGLAGTASTITNSYWDIDSSGQSTATSGKTSGAKGLSGSSADDIAYYANGTIDQVLADRAAAAQAAANAAAAAKAAADAASAEAQAEAQAAAQAQAAAAQAQAQAQATAQAQAQAQAQTRQSGADALAGADLEDARRRGAQTAASLNAQNQLHLLVQRAAPVDEHLLVIDPARFAATIKTIEVDGKLYQVDDEEDAKQH